MLRVRGHCPTSHPRTSSSSATALLFGAASTALGRLLLGSASAALRRRLFVRCGLCHRRRWRALGLVVARLRGVRRDRRATRQEAGNAEPCEVLLEILWVHGWFTSLPGLDLIVPCGRMSVDKGHPGRTAVYARVKTRCCRPPGPVPPPCHKG